MNLQEVKAAVTAGKTVFWNSRAYQVIQQKGGDFLVKCLINNSCVGLTDQYEGEKFFLEVEPEAEPEKEQKYMVFNHTDGFFASPHTFSEADAKEFIKEFPKMYERQGYYRTSNREKINPYDVVLEMLPAPEDDQDEDDSDDVLMGIAF